MRALRFLAFPLVLGAAALAGAGVAEARGCLKGALVGGVAGHYAGHHGVIGAIGGCIAGRQLANRRVNQGGGPTSDPTYGRTGPRDRSY